MMMMIGKLTHLKPKTTIGLRFVRQATSFLPRQQLWRVSHDSTTKLPETFIVLAVMQMQYLGTRMETFWRPTVF